MPDDPNLPPGGQIPDFLRPPLVDPNFAREIHRERALEEAANAAEARINARRAGLPAIPLDLPPPITPVPFPTGAAANDPIAGFSKVPGLLRLGGGLISVAIIVTDILRLAQEERINVMLIEQDLEIDTILKRARQRKAKEKPVRVSPEIILVPPTIEIPEIIVTAPRKSPAPRPTFDPESPVEIPAAPVPEPLPAALPSIPAPGLPQPLPETSPSKSPKPVPTRLPGRLPRGLPFPAPGRLPAFFPLPFSSPVSSPQRQPIGDRLTRPDPGVQQSPRPGAGASFIELPQPQPQPQTDLDRRCRERQKQKQRKNRCDEGFFRETRTGRTEFKVWRTVNCVTGKTVGEQSGDNVFDIFGGR